MKNRFRYLTAPTLSPAGFLAWATVIVLSFLILHSLGWRDHTTILSGTVPRNETVTSAIFKAAFYMATYFGTVVLAPILILASGIGYFWHRRQIRRQA